MHVPETRNQKLPMCVNEPNPIRRMEICAGAHPGNHIACHDDGPVRFDRSPYNVNDRDVSNSK